MSTIMKAASDGNLYRCGFCSKDFSSLDSCVKHMTSHGAEDMSISAGPPLANNPHAPSDNVFVAAPLPTSSNPHAPSDNVFVAAPLPTSSNSHAPLDNVFATATIPNKPPADNAERCPSASVQGPISFTPTNVAESVFTPKEVSLSTANKTQISTFPIQASTSPRQARFVAANSVLTTVASAGKCPTPTNRLSKAVSEKELSGVASTAIATKMTNFQVDVDKVSKCSLPTLSCLGSVKNTEARSLSATESSSTIAGNIMSITTSSATQQGSVIPAAFPTQTEERFKPTSAKDNNGNNDFNLSQKTMVFVNPDPSAMESQTVEVRINGDTSCSSAPIDKNAEKRTGHTSCQEDAQVQTSQSQSIFVQTNASGAFIVKSELTCDSCVNDAENTATQINNLSSKTPKHGTSVVNRKSELHKEGDKSSSLRSKPYLSKDRDRPHACSECPARYRFASSLSVHKKRHSGNEPYECKICKRRFWHPTNLRVHERVHSDERLFVCKICGHGFNQANDLRIHMRIHTGEMPLKCPMADCGRAFRDPACLRRHINKHKGVQPHIACDKCPAKFFHQSGLARHYKRHTGQKDHTCYVCNAAFARGDTLKLHMRIHSGLKPYTCSVCNLSFSDRSYCRRHLNKHDSSLKPKIVTNIRQKYAIKHEVDENDEDSEDKVVEHSQPVQKKRGELIVPVDIPNPNGSDVPIASIEIEIPESELMAGDGSEEMVYQYGDMLITISRSAVEMAEESASKTDVTTDKPEDNPDNNTSTNGTPRPSEHQYSCATNNSQQTPARIINTELISQTDKSANGMTGTSLESAPQSLPQSLSDYNEIVTTIMESEALQDQDNSFKLVSLSKDKLRAPRIGEKRWPCPDCDAAFFHQAELKRHQTKHTGEMPYQCTICGKKVRDPSNLKRHLRTHTGERPYSCHVCKKTFRQAGHLTAHIRIHTGQRPYRCDLCPSTFIEANHLRYHQKVHAGIKPYQCPKCELSFVRNAELKRHSHVHGGEGNLKCHLCPAKYFRADALKMHISKKHNVRLPHQCPVCSLAFSRKTLLDRHCRNKKHHPTTPQSQSEAENNVAADALCELATGRRSSVKTGDNTGVSLASTGPDPNVISMLVEDSDLRTLSIEGGGEGVEMMEVNGEEQYLHRVRVDGGSVLGTRVVLVQSEGMDGLPGIESQQTNEYQLPSESTNDLPGLENKKTVVYRVQTEDANTLFDMENKAINVHQLRSESTNSLSGMENGQTIMYQVQPEDVNGLPGVESNQANRPIVNVPQPASANSLDFQPEQPEMLVTSQPESETLVMDKTEQSDLLMTCEDTSTTHDYFVVGDVINSENVLNSGDVINTANLVNSENVVTTGDGSGSHCFVSDSSKQLCCNVDSGNTIVVNSADVVNTTMGSVVSTAMIDTSVGKFLNTADVKTAVSKACVGTVNRTVSSVSQSFVSDSSKQLCSGVTDTVKTAVSNISVGNVNRTLSSVSQSFVSDSSKQLHSNTGNIVNIGVRNTTDASSSQNVANKSSKQLCSSVNTTRNSSPLLHSRDANTLNGQSNPETVQLINQSGSETPVTFKKTEQTIDSDTVPTETDPVSEVRTKSLSSKSRLVGRSKGKKSAESKQTQGQSCLPFVAPLRTRSGRERKVNMKYFT